MNEIIVGIVVGSVVGLITAAVPIIINYWTGPNLERNILIKKETWLQKKQIFTNAVSLVARQWDAAAFSQEESATPHIPLKNVKPTSTQKNDVLAQLYMLADNKEIPNKFIEVIDGKRSPASIGEFILMLRNEIGTSELVIKPEEMAVFYNTDDVVE